ncbi:MAG: glutamate racemase [Myxococcaceae bacterium]
MRQQGHKAIGVFDSGVGGLTVLKALMARLPGESTVYLGDTARVPYGTKSADVVTRYSVQNAKFLIEQDIKLLVVACNTASAVALPALSKELKIPVVGVIAPGAQAAALKTRNRKVAVIGTPGTIKSGAYQRELEAACPGVSVIGRPCPMFVPLAEEGWTDGEIARLAAERYLGELRSVGVDTLVLGCTHYPLLKSVISQVMGPEVSLVDSAEATVELVARQLEADPTPPSGAEVTHRYFVTDVPDRFLEVAPRFLGRLVEHAEQVDIRF